MSFILDALKKSENERQRQSGPALFEVKVATPKPGLPLWAVALAALLVVNIGVVVWLVLRKPARTAVAAAAPPAAAAIAPGATGQVPVVPPPVVSVPLPQPSQTPADGAQPSAAADDAEPLNPEDYEPAVAPASAPAASTGHASRELTDGLPTYEQIAAGGSLPEMKLDMHVYAAKPEERFVFINMQRLREGDSMANGVRVEQITPAGVVLSHQGSRFVLEHQ